MIVIVKSLADTYKQENKKLELKCEIYEEYIKELERQRNELRNENNAYRVLLKKQLEDNFKINYCPMCGRKLKEGD